MQALRFFDAGQEEIVVQCPDREVCLITSASRAGVWIVGRPAVAITLSPAERQELEGLARRRKTAQGLARRARIVLAAAAGLENRAIAEQMGADANTVGKWRRRSAERRVDGLHDEPRSGAPRQIGDEQIAEVVTRTLEETPPDGTRTGACGRWRGRWATPLHDPPDLGLSSDTYLMLSKATLERADDLLIVFVDYDNCEVTRRIGPVLICKLVGRDDLHYISRILKIKLQPPHERFSPV